MDTYVILRRSGWSTAEAMREAVARWAAEAERTPDDVCWVRSYVLEELREGFGTMCVYRATSPEAIRAHATRAGLPVDEIVKVADTIIARMNPVPTIA